MELEEYRKYKEMFFEVRNNLDSLLIDNPFPLVYYHEAEPIKSFSDNREIIKIAADYRKRKNSDLPLWVCRRTYDLGEFNYDTDKKITNGIQAGEFEVIPVNLIRIGFASMKKIISPKMIFVPKNEKKFPVKSYVRFRVLYHPDPHDVEEFKRDLREMDEFFGNT